MSTSVVYDAAKYISQKFVEYFKERDGVVSLFTVGSMWNLDMYNERQNNDFDIRLLTSQVTPVLLDEIDRFQKSICAELNDFYGDKLYIGYSNIVGPVNHHLSDSSSNLLIHLLVHTVDDLKSFLPLTHQRRYTLYHTLLWGEEYLNCVPCVYDPMYLIDCHEGIRYCIDMLARQTYKYLIWEKNSDGTVSFIYKEEQLPESLRAESVFYSVKNIIDNLYQICIVSREKNTSLEEYAHFLCQSNIEFTGLIDAVLNRNEKKLYSYGDELFNLTIRLLELFEFDIINNYIEVK